MCSIAIVIINCTQDNTILLDMIFVSITTPTAGYFWGPRLSDRYGLVD